MACQCGQHQPASKKGKSPAAASTGELSRQLRNTGSAAQLRRDSASPGPEARAAIAHDLEGIAVQPGSGGGPGGAGLPHGLKAGLERFSGIGLSVVRVHYGSRRPARIDALAYTQGTDIYLARGQERHLPHEGWHAVQQLTGRVRATERAGGLPINTDPGLEREADVMGRRAASFETRLATPGDSDEEPFAARAVRPVVQRVATFAAGTINATQNLAADFIAGQRRVGFTPPTLNGTTILSAAVARGAINAPALTRRTRPDGTAEALVATVPTNTGSFILNLPSDGPWSTTTAKANVAALFTSVGATAPAGCGTAGDTTFTVRGRPADADFATNVRTHELLHVTDHRAGFRAVLVPWDERLEAARTAGTVFSGADAAAAEAALFRAMGGTPNEIADAQNSDWVARSNATHAGKTTVATGGTATPSNAMANPTCTTSSMDVT